MSTPANSWIEYEIFHCQAHKKSIYYFKGTRVEQATMCWDCTREANNKKGKKEK